MMWRTALVALLSHWLRRPLQGISLFLGLALATALWSGVQAINAEARASYDRAARLLGQDRLVRLQSASGSLDQADYVALRRAGWQVSPVVEGRLRVGDRPLRVVGMDPLTLPSDAAGPSMLWGDLPLQEFLSLPGVAYGAPDLVQSLQGVPDLPRLIAAPDLAPGMLLSDVGIAQSLLGMEGRLSHLLLVPEQAMGLAPLAELAPQLREHSPDDGTDVARLTDSFHLNLTAFGFLAFAVGLFIVHGTIGLAFEQRRPLMRTLRAMGVPLRSLMVLMACELGLVAVLAAGVGMGLGGLLAAWLLPDVAATLRGLYGAAVGQELTLTPMWWLAGAAMTLAGTALAGTQSLIRLARLPLFAPAQPRAWIRASQRGLRWQLGVGGLLLVLALLLLMQPGLWRGFAALGALLIGAALALPALLAGALALGERISRAALSRWFWADTRQQVPGLSLALMALLLALAANVGVGTMVSSFRLTFTGWLDQRLAAELYVTARDETEATRLRAWLAPRAQAVLPIWNVTTRAAGQPADLYGIADHATYRDHWPLIARGARTWARVAGGEGLLINEQLARRQGLEVDDMLAVDGLAQALPIAGIYSDYGNPRAQVIVSVGLLEQHFPQVPRLRHGLRVAPQEAPALMRALSDEFGLPPEQITDQAAIKAFSMQVFERTFTVTAALNLLTLAVAGFAILTAFLTLAGMRLPQLAPVWALGVTRRHLALLELARALMLCLMTMVFALPLGLGLAWVLLQRINVAAFGWQLPMFVFPADWLVLMLVALLAGALAALWPMLRLMRLRPAALLGIFAHER